MAEWTVEEWLEHQRRLARCRRETRVPAPASVEVDAVLYDKLVLRFEEQREYLGGDLKLFCGGLVVRRIRVVKADN